jgi:hypothetical protein
MIALDNVQDAVYTDHMMKEMAMSEQYEMPSFDLFLFDWNMDLGTLVMRNYNQQFPNEFMVRSHRTGKEVRFVRVSMYDVLYDQDMWDGEQMLYRPMGNVPNVNYAALCRG